MHPRIPLAFLATRVHCWLKLTYHLNYTSKTTATIILSFFSSSSAQAVCCLSHYLGRAWVTTTTAQGTTLVLLRLRLWLQIAAKLTQEPAALRRGVATGPLSHAVTASLVPVLVLAWPQGNWSRVMDNSTATAPREAVLRVLRSQPRPSFNSSMHKQLPKAI